MEAAVVTLLVSTLASTGLLAVWATTWPSHWFLRTAAFLAALAPLLLIPAYEPFVALLIEGVVVAVGIHLGGWLSRRRNLQPSRRLRFSLHTLLLLTPLVGLAAFVASRLPDLNRYAWQSIVIVGAAGGVATLLAWYAWSRRGWLKWMAACAAVIGGVLCGWLTALADMLLPSLFGIAQWPPDRSVSPPNWLGQPDEMAYLWLVIGPAVVVTTFIELLILRRSSLLARGLVGCDSRVS